MDFEFFKELCELKTPLEKTEFAANSLNKDFCVEQDGLRRVYRLKRRHFVSRYTFGVLVIIFIGFINRR